MRDNTSAEALLDRFIEQRGLAQGSPLPAADDLATVLACDAESIAKALIAAERKGKIARAADGSAVVAAPVPHATYEAFSFTRSAYAHGERLVTTLVEKAVRLPIRDRDHPFHALEQRAQEALGLSETAPFIAIVRARHLHGEPLVFHRVYLDPARFPDDILDLYDFEAESLIAIYRRHGYEMASRDTVLVARLTNRYEDNMLRTMGSEVHLQAVLDAEQQSFCTHRDGQGRFVLEYMQATYLKQWRYEIKNRPAPNAPA